MLCLWSWKARPWSTHAQGGAADPVLLPHVQALEPRLPCHGKLSQDPSLPVCELRPVLRARGVRGLPRKHRPRPRAIDATIKSGIRTVCNIQEVIPACLTKGPRAPSAPLQNWAVANFRTPRSWGDSSHNGPPGKDSKPTLSLYHHLLPKMPDQDLSHKAQEFSPCNEFISDVSTTACDI